MFSGSTFSQEGDKWERGGYSHGHQPRVQTDNGLMLFDVGIKDDASLHCVCEIKPLRGKHDPLFCFFKGFYLFMRHTQRQRHRQREKKAPSGEHNVGLDPRTLGSQPQQKAEAQPLSHPGAPA